MVGVQARLRIPVRCGSGETAIDQIVVRSGRPGGLRISEPTASLCGLDAPMEAIAEGTFRVELRYRDGDRLADVSFATVRDAASMSLSGVVYDYERDRSTRFSPGEVVIVPVGQFVDVRSDVRDVDGASISFKKLEYEVESQRVVELWRRGNLLIAPNERVGSEHTGGAAMLEALRPGRATLRVRGNSVEETLQIEVVDPGR